MGLSIEHPLIQRQHIWGTEEEEQVLQGLSQPEALHDIVMSGRHGSHVLHQQYWCYMHAVVTLVHVVLSHEGCREQAMGVLVARHQQRGMHLRTVHSVTAKMGNIVTSAINNNSDWVNLIVRLTA